MNFVIFYVLQCESALIMMSISISTITIAGNKCYYIKKKIHNNNNIIIVI